MLGNDNVSMALNKCEGDKYDREIYELKLRAT